MDTNATFAEVEKIGLEVVITERTVKDRWVYILGEKFDAEDLYETLSAIDCNHSRTYVTCSRMVQMLKDIGIISGSSASWGTTVTDEDHLNQILNMLETALEASGSDYV
jgi:hypothetical protein